MKHLKLRLILLSLASGLLLSLAWPERGCPALLFIGFIPLLRMEDLISTNRDRFNRFSVFFYSYPGFLLWNLLTTWWIVNSTGEGAILAVVLNSMFMSIILSFFHGTKRRLNSMPAAYLALICFWIMFEYLHLNWDLNWPWLNLGNGFSSYYRWVQWYEYTGAFGGTVWVLAANIMIFSLLKGEKRKAKSENKVEISEKRKAKSENEDANFGKSIESRLIQKFHLSLFAFRFSIISLLILLPILFSYVMYYSYHEKSRPVNTVILQPNIDPYSEQYVLPPMQVVGRIVKLAGPAIDSGTNILVTPESALQQEMWENNMETFESIGLVRNIISKYPNLNIIVGGSTYYAFKPGEKIPHTARKFTKENAWYNRYNAAIMVNRYPALQLYHKSKLTPGVEVLPSYNGFKWLEKYAIDLGGIVGSLGTDSVRRVFNVVNMPPVAVCICYESIFGEFFSEFVRNGAQVMCIITNDGWWGNTAGHRQHFAFAHLRAIETRRSILRSANTGISAWIDQRGDAHEQTKYWVPAVIKARVNANDKITFYTRHGDYIAKWMSWLGGLLYIGSLLVWITKKRIKKS
ncbi:MAG: apolipoprotein N-acyltransferase [Bacteroidetes bacterium]|nr:apolipoprotein N-acyltransferase [Bacteroidota bacterium]